MTATSAPEAPASRFPWRAAAWASALGLWLLPLVAMQFTTEVNWSPGDFLLFGLMLLVTGGALELLLRAGRSTTYRLAAVIAVLTGFFLVWANLAVGLVGDERNPDNLWFFALPLVGLVGAALARLRPRGMMFTMLVVAAAQLALGAALLAHQPVEVGAITAAFTGLWLMSAGLFRWSMRGRIPD